jgi:hypothetical protein
MWMQKINSYIELMVKQHIQDDELEELGVDGCDVKHVKCCLNRQMISSFEQSGFSQNETIIMMSNGEQITALVDYNRFKLLFFNIN